MKFKRSYPSKPGVTVFQTPQKKPLLRFKSAPKPSLVEVYFSERGRSFSYYNDRFDLHKDDVVFVEGKLEGVPGTVLSVNYNFRIRLSDYKKIISVADTHIYGKLYQSEKYVFSFDRNTIPYSKIASWYFPPENSDDIIASGTNDDSIHLEEWEDMDVSTNIFYRGIQYAQYGHVKYICLDHGRGKAIVSGSKNYLVEFKYEKGMVSHLTCDCFCAYTCKHQVAVLHELYDILKQIKKDFTSLFWTMISFYLFCKNMWFLKKLFYLFIEHFGEM